MYNNITKELRYLVDDFITQKQIGLSYNGNNEKKGS